MITCPSCGSENPDAAQFCNNCGRKISEETIKPVDSDTNEEKNSRTEIVQRDSLGEKPNVPEPTKKCPYCAETIKAEAIVCRYCGRDLRPLTYSPNLTTPSSPTRSFNLGRIGCMIFLAVLVIGVIFLLVSTNPSKEVHNTAIYTNIGQSAGSQLGGELGGLLGGLLGRAAGNITNSIDMSIFKYHNYFLFSTTTLSDRVISFGILGNVFIITPANEIIDILQKSITDLPANLQNLTPLLQTSPIMQPSPILQPSPTIDQNSVANDSIWSKYINNPVLDKGSPEDWDSGGVGAPSVLYQNESFMLWYDGYHDIPNNGQIGFATSLDGLNWTKSANNPVLTVGASGNWDSGWAITPDVIFHNGLYEMWYQGSNYPDAPVAESFGYATSIDGIKWVKYQGNPVLQVGPPGSWDDSSFAGSSIIVEGNTYKMWYSALDRSGIAQIGYATSIDGIHWTKYIGNPVLTVGSPGSWDSHRVANPNVSFNGNNYEMWYSGDNDSNYAIGSATSPDGINWTKYPNHPILSSGINASWDSDDVSAPSVFLQSGLYKMWYTGSADGYYYKIGYATSK